MQHVARALAKKEFLQLVRRRQLLWLGLAEAVLAFASFSLAGRQWQREAESALVLADTNQRRLANVSDWADLEGVGVLVAPPTPAGRFLVSSKTWPGFLVTVPELPTPLGGLNQEGLPSPAQALLVFYTLFALVLSFDVISGEKSQRTLGLLLAVTTSRRQLLQVKVLVRCAVVALMVIVSQLFAVLVVSFLFPDFVKDPSFFQIFSALLLFLIIASVLFAAALADWWIAKVYGRPMPASFRDEIVAFMAQGRGSTVPLPVATDSDTEHRLRAMVGLLFIAPEFLRR